MIDTVFFDLGGVLLTNGWDRETRRRAAERFGLEENDFQDRHEHVVGDFETGRITLETYLERTVFFEPRPFAPSEFRAFMFAQSAELPGALAFVRALRESGTPRLAALNNESLELNRYRIEHFRLRELFDLFFSSCYVGLRKPDQAIYRLALDVTQTSPERSLLVDDRAINVESAARLGMQTVHHHDLNQLRGCLRGLGIGDVIHLH